MQREKSRQTKKSPLRLGYPEKPGRATHIQQLNTQSTMQNRTVVFSYLFWPHEAGTGTIFARHGVKLYSQSGCDPRKQSEGRKDTT